MALAGVVVHPDVLLAALGHALTTEKEEIMGLLLGDFVETDAGTEAHVWDLYLLTRTDRQSDRVEVSPEQLVEANIAAEGTVAFGGMRRQEMGQRIGCTTRVVGWYHSHPKITVLPSHIDVRTQAQNQLMDDRFFGLIFACFYRAPDQLHKVQLTAFQSVEQPGQGLVRTHTPVYVRRVGPAGADPMHMFSRLPTVLFDEERATFERALASAPPETSGLPARLARINAGAVYTRAMTALLDKLSVAILEMLEQRHARVLDQIQQAQKRLTELEAEENGLFA